MKVWVTSPFCNTNIYLLRICRDFVSLAHSEGNFVVYWTLNDPAEMAACLAAGADGFFTDEVMLGSAALCISAEQLQQQPNHSSPHQLGDTAA